MFVAGWSWFAVATSVFLYYLRMFGLTAGYHRYFSHKSYRTSRLFQFVLAWIGASAVQKGPLWWAAHHRHHHRFSDTEDDVHSPIANSGLVFARRLDLSDPKEQADEDEADSLSAPLSRTALD